MNSEQTLFLERYASDAKTLVAGAQTLADERKHAQVEPIHFLVRALDRDRGVAEIFRVAGADPADVAKEAEAQLSRIPKGDGGLAYVSTALMGLLGRAEKEAEGKIVRREHLLNALSQELRGAAASVLQSFGLGPGSFRPFMSVLGDVSGGVSNESASRFTLDLLERAKKGALGPVLGRDVEVRRLLQILERRHKNHPLLVGEPGVGKSAIVSALAMRIAAGDVPENVAKLRILELETGLLAAGAKLRGEIEERLKQVLASVKAGNDALLYISGLDTLIGQGNLGGSVGDLLKPMLSRGEVRLLASTTPDGFRKLNEKDPALLRCFAVLGIEPSTADESVEILRGIATRFEDHHRVQIGDPAILAAVRLAKRYVQDRALPDSAIDLLDEAAARKRVEIDGLPAGLDQKVRRLASLRAQLAGLEGDADPVSLKTRERLENELGNLEPSVTELRARLDSSRKGVGAEPVPQARVLTEEDVALVLGDWTKIPVSKMLEAESEKLLKMEERLSMRVVGQEEAVRGVSRATRRGRIGLRDPGKPIGSFLFLGPSGVGKTELAKALAEFLFDDEQSLLRLDMSEFMEKHMAQRLLGAPPGYVDSEQGGFLTEAVRKRPYSVLLFDEVEKAHADVFNLLLQVLDDGRLTDGRGKTADFSNTVIIMTSNIGSGRILETDRKLFESPEGRDALRDALREDLRSFLRPEFLNRVDDIVVFRPLSKEDLRKIVDIQLRRLEMLLGDRDLSLSLTERAKIQLVELGYEPAFGARPLKRAILKKVQDPLAEEILAGGYAPGSIVNVDCEGEEFRFEKGPKA